MGHDKQEIKGKMEIAGVMGPLWFTGWLFCVGFLKLGTGKAVLGLLLWPYYLGAALGG